MLGVFLFNHGTIQMLLFLGDLNVGTLIVSEHKHSSVATCDIFRFCLDMFPKKKKLFQVRSHMNLKNEICLTLHIVNVSFVLEHTNWNRDLIFYGGQLSCL